MQGQFTQEGSICWSLGPSAVRIKCLPESAAKEVKARGISSFPARTAGRWPPCTYGLCVRERRAGIKKPQGGKVGQAWAEAQASGGQRGGDDLML